MIIVRPIFGNHWEVYRQRNSDISSYSKYINILREKEIETFEKKLFLNRLDNNGGNKNMDESFLRVIFWRISFSLWVLRHYFFLR